MESKQRSNPGMGEGLMGSYRIQHHKLIRVSIVLEFAPACVRHTLQSAVCSLNSLRAESTSWFFNIPGVLCCCPLPTSPLSLVPYSPPR